MANINGLSQTYIDKVTVWSSGNARGESSTANFLSGLMKSPPMNQLFDMAGMELPEYLCKTNSMTRISRVRRASRMPTYWNR